jgi:hypothetical protein
VGFETLKCCIVPCRPTSHCCSNKRTLIKFGYLKPVRLCNKCNASCFKADLLLNAVGCMGTFVANCCFTHERALQARNALVL